MVVGARVVVDGRVVVAPNGFVDEIVVVVVSAVVVITIVVVVCPDVVVSSFPAYGLTNSVVVPVATVIGFGIIHKKN